ncbi:MAG TPA: hypothetical protein VGB55_00080, partial [Tepidisphaeraceae bacterium]
LVAISAARVEEKMGLPLTEPSFPRSCGIIGRLLKQIPSEELVQRIDLIFKNWDAIQAATSWMTTPLNPADPGILTHRAVADVLGRIERGESPTRKTTRNPRAQHETRKDVQYVYDNE